MTPESIRWYYSDGNICTTVENKFGDKQIKPTVTHTRRMGLYPSVTSILKISASYGLNQWIGENLVRWAAITPSPFAGEGWDISDPWKLKSDMLEDMMEGFIQDVGDKANIMVEDAANTGKFLHGELADFIEHGVLPESNAGKRICDDFKRFLDKQHVSDISCEKSFVSREHGFAGTPDVVGSIGDGAKILIDLKTTDLEKFRKPYDTWLLQLGAYSLGTSDIQDVHLWQAVADRNTGCTVFTKHERATEWTNAFGHLAEVFFVMKNYDPRKYYDTSTFIDTSTIYAELESE